MNSSPSSSSTFTVVRHMFAVVMPGSDTITGETCSVLPLYPVSSYSSRSPAFSGSSSASTSPAGSSTQMLLTGGRNCRTMTVDSGFDGWEMRARMATASTPAFPLVFLLATSQSFSWPFGVTHLIPSSWTHFGSLSPSLPSTLASLRLSAGLAREVDLDEDMARVVLVGRRKDWSCRRRGMADLGCIRSLFLQIPM